MTDTKQLSRTILIFNDQSYKLPDIEYKNKFTSKNGNTFVEYNNLDDSKTVYTELESNKINVKYIYYNIFFRLYKDISKLELSELKDLLKNKLLENYSELNLIDSIFYSKNKKYIGSGYFIVDNFNDYNTFINNNKLIIGDESEYFNFYKFYRKK